MNDPLLLDSGALASEIESSKRSKLDPNGTWSITVNPTPQSAPDSKLTAILEICQQMNSKRDLGALLDVIARDVACLLSADRASIFLLDREKKEFWSKVALGSEEILRFDARLGIAGAVVLNGRTINVEDAHEDRRFYSGMDERTGYYTRSMICVPLQNHAGEIFGVFEALNKKNDGAFTSEDEEILKAVSAQVGIAIENVQLLEELQRRSDELVEENTQLRKKVEGDFAAHNIIGTSSQIQSVVRLIEQIHDTSVNVLITGESGTGKELVARAVHYSSSRARQRFEALNCAALPEELVESELFGIERGVATGVDKRPGRFEAAHGGTLFLDEIGDLSLAAQAKILRVLQENVVQRVGSRKSLSIDVRVLAATNKDLSSEIKNGTFREDLYYRLNIVHVPLPALREIRDDIPLLANHFVRQAAREMNRRPPELSTDALACLCAYDWPGNVRQLQNEVKRAVACTRRKMIRVEDLAEPIRAARQGARLQGASGQTLRDVVAELEQRMITDSLVQNRNNQFRTAKALGLSRQGLLNKMKRYGIKPDRPSTAEA